MFDEFGYLGFLFAVASLFGIGYLKKRISELTIAVGMLIEELEEQLEERNK